jgi:hypothetical protein
LRLTQNIYIEWKRGRPGLGGKEGGGGAGLFPQLEGATRGAGRGGAGAGNGGFRRGRPTRVAQTQEAVVFLPGHAIWWGHLAAETGWVIASLAAGRGGCLYGKQAYSWLGACEYVACSWAVPFFDVFRAKISPHKSLDGRCPSTSRAAIITILSRARRKMPQPAPADPRPTTTSYRSGSTSLWLQPRFSEVRHQNSSARSGESGEPLPDRCSLICASLVVYLSSVISQCGDLLLAVSRRTSSSQTMSAYRIIEGRNIANPCHITHNIDRQSSPSKKAVRIHGVANNYLVAGGR